MLEERHLLTPKREDMEALEQALLDLLCGHIDLYACLFFSLSQICILIAIIKL